MMLSCGAFLQGFRQWLPLVLAVCLLIMAGRAQASSRPLYVATIQPLAAILEQVAGKRAEVVRLLPPGGSPHTFEPKPSDALLLRKAAALFYAGPGLDKEWTQGLATGKRVEMLELVPAALRLQMADHGHEPHETKHGGEETSPDPHFWTDPLTVRAMLPALVEKLTALDPAGAVSYSQSSARFAAELTKLSEQVAVLLEPVRHQPIFLFHPSFQYLLHRYDLDLAGIIEHAPGREPSPRDLLRLVKRIRKTRAQALFTEPQLPQQPAEAVAEAAGVPLYQLDPLGGTKGRQTYEELILYNARTLAEALGKGG